MNSVFPNSRKSPRVVNGRVAIVMRTKNRPLLLARAFASVLSQTYANWFLCLVNDGGEREVLERSVEPYRFQFGDRLAIRHHEHSLGMEAASNAALELVDSDYVVVHDDDDSWHPEFLEQTVAYLERSDNMAYGAVAARCEVIHEDIAADRVKMLSREPWVYWEDRIDFMNMARANSIPPICLLIRRYIVNIIGAYNANLPVLGDWDYSLRIMAVCDIGTINDDLAYYHHRKNSGANYGNSVHSGIDKHLTYQTLYRNAMVRSFLQADPSRLGLLHLMLLRIEKLEESMHGRLAHVDSRFNDVHKHLDWVTEQTDRRFDKAALTMAELAELTVGVFEQTNRRFDEGDRNPPTWARNLVVFGRQGWMILRPIAWLWRRLRPIRHVIAKLRGRI